MSGLQGRPARHEFPSSQGRPPYETVQPNDGGSIFVPLQQPIHGGAPADAQQYNDSTKGAGLSATGEMGGVKITTENDSWTNYLNVCLAILQWVLLGFLLIAAFWFYIRLPTEGHQDVILQGFHSKHHRLFIGRNMVNLYNHTTLGLAVFQGGLLIGSPTIPGSGLLIVNKRSTGGQLHDLSQFDGKIVDENDSHLMVHDEDGAFARDMRKRGIQAYTPESLYSGINIRDDSNIAMAGGDILGASSITAETITANVRSQKNGTTAQVAQIERGMAVGFQLNGSLGLGFAPNPEALEPLVVQEFYLNEDDQDDGLVSARFNEEKFFVLYQNASAGPVLAIVGTLDADNRATYQGGAASIVLPAGTLGTDMLACSLEGKDGTGASVVLVVYKSAIDNDLYARVCDLSVPTAPVCGPSTNVSTGDAGANGVYVYAASGIKLQSLTCPILPSDGTLTTKRWFIVAWTDSVSGHEMAQQIQANVALPLPNVTVVTATRTVGIVDNQTDVSTSTDLANADKGSIAVERLQGPNFVTAWRTGVSHNEGKFEVSFINVTSLTIELAARSATPFMAAYDNLADAYWTFDISVSQREAYLLGAEKQSIFLAYNVGPSTYGQLFFSTLEVPTDVADVVGSSPWIVSSTIEFSDDINPIYTYAFPSSAGITVEGICSNQAVVSYVSGGVGVSQAGYTVLVNLAPTQACIRGAVCGSITPRVPFTASVPYLTTTMWRTLASDGFDCSSSALTSFITVSASYADVDYHNTTVNVAPGVAGEYTVSYAPLDTPRQVVGIVSDVYDVEGLVSYVTTGEIDICDTAYSVDGRLCPFEAPAPVFACPSGHLTFSPYCADTNVNSPAQLVGYTDVWGNLQVQPQVQYAF